MNKSGVIVFAFCFFLICCSNPKEVQEPAAESGNPFFEEYTTPFGAPPFDRIGQEHYFPAFMRGMEEQKKEIQAIIDNEADPTFANCIEALERSGALLSKVSLVFYNLMSSHTNEELQALAKEVSPLLSKHSDDILLSEELFQKIKTVYEERADLNLELEQSRLLKETFKTFVRGGANLGPEEQTRLREINEELSLLTLTFGENVLKENKAFELVIEDEVDLVGLPESAIVGAAETAEKKGHPGHWVFTLDKPSMIPFLQFSERRNLREKIFNAYIHRGDNDNERDNKTSLAKIAALRVERSQLLGYPTHAHFVLDQNMAKEPGNVYEFLNKLWIPALERAKQEAKDLQDMIDQEGHDFKLQPWDWWFYAGKVKKAKYDLDDSQLRPYFQLEKVRNGAFDVANKLFGITFEENTNIPKYHQEVTPFEVKEADGSHLGILYLDYFPRKSKRGGAWMNNFREQSKSGGENIRPIIVNVGNFSRPTGDDPSLLSLEETLTLFHEFGHALHGLLSDCTYESLSGTAVPRDFVELPSQIMENWALDPEVIKSYAEHYQTGESIPQDLIDKIKKSGNFNQGFATVEYLAACYLDMDWHTLKTPEELKAEEFETQSLSRIGMIPEIVVRYRSPYFSHIFSGGYSSGYYSYIWAEVLDADAFEAFKETSLFDPETAESFRTNILERGGTEDPMTLYKNFRGAKPKIDALLKRRGLI